MPYKDMVRGSGIKRDMASVFAQVGARKGGWYGFVTERDRSHTHSEDIQEPLYATRIETLSHL